VSDLDRPTRVRLYLYGTRNLVGSACALIGPILLFTGVIHDYWLLITAGLYGAGWLLAPAPKPVDTKELVQSLSTSTLLARLDEVIGQAKPALPAELSAHLTSIRGSIGEVLPRLSADAAGDDLFVVRQTVLRYLPETLGNYLALPPLFRTTKALRDGKTARDLLGDQLSVLDTQMKEVVGNVARGDAEALLANGRFLEAKFTRRDFLEAPGSRS
jgi:hypothetical protein